MKRVLLLIPYYSSFYKPLRNAFAELGFEVKSYDYRRGENWIRILRFTPFLGKSRVQMLIDRRITNLVKSFGPQIILTVKGELLSKELINKIKNKNNRIVNWFPDPMNTWDLMVKIAPYYDFFLHFDPYIIKKLRALGYKNVFYLPFAAELTPKSNYEKIYDVSFVGTYSKNREKVLSTIKDLRLSIWGDPRWNTSSLQNYTRNGRVSQSKMKEIIQKSKININIHFDVPGEGANLRTFETTGSGGFLLTNYVKDLRNLFVINKEIVCYQTMVELRTKIKLYLANNKLREEISSNGQKKAMHKHNYGKRIKQMLNIIYE